MAELEERGIDVPAPGGNEWSRDADKRCGMDRYVHLTFKQGHPMEHGAVSDGRIQQLAHVRVKPSVLRLPGVLGTNEVANKAGVVPVPLPELIASLDREVLYSRTNWHDPTIQERLKVAEKFEIVVPDAIPLEFIVSFG